LVFLSTFSEFFYLYLLFGRSSIQRSKSQVASSNNKKVIFSNLRYLTPSSSVIYNLVGYFFNLAQAHVVLLCNQTKKSAKFHLERLRRGYQKS